MAEKNIHSTRECPSLKIIHSSPDCKIIRTYTFSIGTETRKKKKQIRSFSAQIECFDKMCEEKTLKME
ncbi:hypothetical protein DERF_008247 [Dermatophagoides farinae]|uniref:Uncharacterized protein n=1 Tax=Dermatophagoides farinae TaxID=6954 RepID=A0A922L8Z1_DERFA|nr:hypothetical protein DERF_008247 [Dermatophagoides farinae]